MNDKDESVSGENLCVDALDIASMLRAVGPVVKCVVLRSSKPPNSKGRKAPLALTDNAEDIKPPTFESEAKSTPVLSKTDLLEDLVDEIEIDTTPQKNSIQTLLGGPFTFLGQYEDEGTVLMALRDSVDGLDDGNEFGDGGLEFDAMSIRQLRDQCKQCGIDTTDMVEKQEPVDALKHKEKKRPPINPHRLQPPLHRCRVRGDIVIVRVAETDEALDQDDDEESDKDENDTYSADHATSLIGDCNEKREKSIITYEKDEADGELAEKETASDIIVKVPSNDEFFLNYTRAEYLKFAARTDFKAEELLFNGEGEAIDEKEENREADNDNNANEHDEDFPLADAALAEMTEEEEKSAMLNIVMSELLRKFREENERGATSREVLEIRSSVAEQLEMGGVATYDETQEATDNDRKRAPIPPEGVAQKRVKFDSSFKTEITGEDEETKIECDTELETFETPSKRTGAASKQSKVQPEESGDEKLFE